MALGIAWASGLLVLFVSVFVADRMGLFTRKNHFPVDGRTVIITGGSQGMGKSVAILLAKKGANVLIVARNVQKLEDALKEISASAIRPSTQRFHYISADLTSPTEATRIISEATEWNNSQTPDILWCCAGSARPGLFIDLPTSVLKEQVDSNYLSSAYCAHAFLQPWLQSGVPAQDPRPKHLIFTSSIVAFFPIVGYSPYAPTKVALRALSDSLRQELQLYRPLCRVETHTIFPGTIFSPGLDVENETKPGITKKLEESDDGQTPEELASTCVRSLEHGDEMVTSGLLAKAMKAGSLGNSSRNGWAIVDTLLAWVVAIVIVLVRRDMDGTVRKWGAERLGKKTE